MVPRRHRLRRLQHMLFHPSFTIRFAAVILVAGVMIAVVPLQLAQANTKTQAAERAADKVGIAANLITGQRQSLDSFAAGVARQITANGALSDPQLLATTLEQDAAVNQTGDLLGVMRSPSDVVAVREARTMDGRDPLVDQLSTAVRAQQSTAIVMGEPWLLSRASIAGTNSLAFVARPLTAVFIAALDRNLATSVDPADVAIVRDARLVVGTVSGQQLAAGQALAPSLGDAVHGSQPLSTTIASPDIALATAPLGAGFVLMVTTPVDAVSVAWQPLALLFALILIAMLFIVVVVQTSLQRPLRRLDRAVAAMGRGDFDVPVPAGPTDELSRLGATFEAMRKQLHATMRANSARVSIATQLSISQPLDRALSNVCSVLSANIDVDALLIVVTGSEMTDPFSIVHGIADNDYSALLSGDGPLGEGFRFEGPGALRLGAGQASAEAHLGLHEFCVAPLRVGKHVHGVLAAANASRPLLGTDEELVASAAEQVALALERYRFLAVVQRQASIDDLTSLYNHRFLVDYLGQQVALAERLNNPLAILMLDIDHFKVLNDTHGHQAGDAALAAFAQTLLSCVRRSDLAARYGGEEFSVVMANTTAQDARIVAEKIRAAVAETPIEIRGGVSISLTVSIGGAAYPEDTETASELLALADEALYSAKRAGRDRTRMASDGRRRAGKRPPMKVLHTPQSRTTRSDTRSARPRYRSAK